MFSAVAGSRLNRRGSSGWPIGVSDAL
jgi:hypothetical protein